MRVLHVTQPTTEGVAVVVRNLVADQVARGWHVAVACPEEGWLAEAVAELGAEHLLWASVRSPSRGVPNEVAVIGAHVAEFGPDLVHLHSSKAGLCGRLAIRGSVATVFQPHSWSFHAAGKARALAVFWERWAQRWTSRVFAVSQGEVAEGISAGVHANYVVVPNGVDIARYGRLTRGDARAKLQLPDAPTVVCVGRLARQKGQDRLISIWPTVAKSIPHARLIIVGDGPLRGSLEKSARSSIHFVGASLEAEVWLASADLVVLPSRWEAGSSLALLEAMASRRSVVATRVAGLEDALRAGCGAIVTGNDPDELAAAVVLRLADPSFADGEGAAGRSVIERAFEVRSLSHRAGDEYGALLSAGERQADGP